MRKRFFYFMLLSFFTLTHANAAEYSLDNRFINKTLYKNIYPSTLNNTKSSDTKNQGKPNIKNTNPGTTKSANRRIVKRPTRARTAEPAKTNIQKTQKNLSTGAKDTRRVVPRANVARSGTNRPQNNTVARAGTNPKRRVIARSAAQGNRTRSGLTSVTVKTTDRSPMSSQQCFANYKECMDRYCERNDTAYNRCYCSAKLAQIDAKYQDKIDSLVQQIIRLQYNSVASSDEIKSYWNETVGTYTNTNPWVNIDNALNIDWASTESRVRGQNAFITGHSYCVNYLRSCSYMSSNLRDAYKSEIERDCAAYEKDLSRIQIAAESVIESYNQ